MTAYVAGSRGAHHSSSLASRFQLLRDRTAAPSRDSVNVAARWPVEVHLYPRRQLRDLTELAEASSNVRRTRSLLRHDPVSRSPDEVDRDVAGPLRAAVRVEDYAQTMRGHRVLHLVGKGDKPATMPLTTIRMLMARDPPPPGGAPGLAGQLVSGVLEVGRAMGGASGSGCVGHACSPFRSEGGTGRSSIGKSGSPDARSNRKTKPLFAICATASTRSPPRDTVTRCGAAGRSRSQRS